MIGRVYRWRDAFWIVHCRGEPFDRGPRRNVLIERVVRPAEAIAAGVRMLVLYEDLGTEVVWAGTGERVVRPFRGLRRA